MLDEITVDGIDEMEFRRSIENMLRHGQVAEALEKLKALLGHHAGAGKILPARMLTITSADLTISGWDQLAERLEKYDRPEAITTALGIGIGDPEDAGQRPDENGNLAPCIETTFFSDSAYPFSDADRDDLLEGYSSFGCEWQGNFEHSDETLSVEGIDDLYGAIAELENKVSRSDRPDPDDIEAGAVGACYIGVLIYQAVKDTVLTNGLPRPLSVLLVNSDGYPFFDAPVMSCDEYIAQTAFGDVAPATAAADLDEEEEGEEEAEPLRAGGMASLEGLLGSGSQGTRKKPVLALSADEAHDPLGLEEEAACAPPIEFEPGPQPEDLEGNMPEQVESLNTQSVNIAKITEPDEDPDSEGPAAYTPIDFAALKKPMGTALPRKYGPEDDNVFKQEPDTPARPDAGDASGAEDIAAHRAKPIFNEDAAVHPEPAVREEPALPEGRPEAHIENSDPFEIKPSDWYSEPAPAEETNDSSFEETFGESDSTDQEPESAFEELKATLAADTPPELELSDDHANDLIQPYEPVQRAAPASHSIRQRVRISMEEEPAEEDSLFARVLCWMRSFIARFR